MRHPFRPLALAIPLALLAGCGGAGTSAAPSSTPTARTAKAPVNREALAAEIADTLQACSYDGAPVKVDPKTGGAEPPADCRDMVGTIMRHTGLPQNFDVVEADVPNAAAVILLDDHKLPHRVIAFNPKFMDVVRAATKGDRWAPVSVLAHEIGHHLSGHTIMPGGSQPPTELEADKFSGFVLYKMGASLDDSLAAMRALVPEGPDGPTHPGRGKRVAAITDGWKEACMQQGSRGCTGGESVASTPAQSPVDDAPTPRPAPIAVPTTPTTAAVARGADVLPAPGSTPSKFNRFVYDEFGMLDPAEKQRMETRMFQLARDTGVEVVTLLVDDLHGMSAQDYAWAMMRQLRVGKLDVGNGAVLVAAPQQNEAAIAMGPGVMLELRDYLDLDTGRLRSFNQLGWPTCRKYGHCEAWTEQFFGATKHIADMTKHWEWTIRYPSLQAMQQVYNAGLKSRMADGARYDPNTDPTWRKIARIEATVTDLAPTGGVKSGLNDISIKRIGPALRARTADGQDIVLYMDPHTAGLQPAGALQVGRRYSFVAREQFIGGTPPQFAVLSYDLR